MESFYFCMDFFFIFSKTDAVINCVQHQEKSDHKSRDDSGQKKIADGSTGGHTVHDKRNARRNDNAGGLI